MRMYERERATHSPNPGRTGTEREAEMGRASGETIWELTASYYVKLTTGLEADSWQLKAALRTRHAGRVCITNEENTKRTRQLGEPSDWEAVTAS